MSARPFEGRPSAAELAAERRIRRIDDALAREEQIRRLHGRLDALLFWAAVMLALAGIGLQMGWGL